MWAFLAMPLCALFIASGGASAAEASESATGYEPPLPKTEEGNGPALVPQGAWLAPEAAFPREDPVREHLRNIRDPHQLDKVRKAHRALADMGAKGARAALTLFGEDDHATRIRAILVVRDADEPRAAGLLVPMLMDPHPDVRYHASLALRTLFDRQFYYHYEASHATRLAAAHRWREHLEAVYEQMGHDTADDGREHAGERAVDADAEMKDESQ